MQQEAQDRIRGLQGELAPAKWDGVDTSGIRVVGKAVLVLMDECPEKTQGGIIITESERERVSSGAESGVLVAISRGAFLLNEDMTPWEGEKPSPGDRIYIAKYAGQLVRGKDGRIYRLMDYGNVGAVYDSISVAKPAKQPSKEPTAKGKRVNGRSKRTRGRR